MFWYPLSLATPVPLRCVCWLVLSPLLLYCLQRTRLLAARQAPLPPDQNLLVVIRNPPSPKMNPIDRSVAAGGRHLPYFPHTGTRETLLGRYPSWRDGTPVANFIATAGHPPARKEMTKERERLQEQVSKTPVGKNLYCNEKSSVFGVSSLEFHPAAVGGLDGEHASRRPRCCPAAPTWQRELSADVCASAPVHGAPFSGPPVPRTPETGDCRAQHHIDMATTAIATTISWPCTAPRASDMDGNRLLAVP